jgi:hypothetical protein
MFVALIVAVRLANKLERAEREIQRLHEVLDEVNEFQAKIRPRKPGLHLVGDPDDS